MQNFDTNAQTAAAEAEIWNMLGMDDVETQMNNSAIGSDSVVMGTGQTSNACNMCDGSNTTAGCNGC